MECYVCVNQTLQRLNGLYLERIHQKKKKGRRAQDVLSEDTVEGGKARC